MGEASRVGLHPALVVVLPERPVPAALGGDAFGAALRRRHVAEAALHQVGALVVSVVLVVGFVLARIIEARHRLTFALLTIYQALARAIRGFAKSPALALLVSAARKTAL